MATVPYLIELLLSIDLILLTLSMLHSEYAGVNGRGNHGEVVVGGGGEVDLYMNTIKGIGNVRGWVQGLWRGQAKRQVVVEGGN